MKAYNPRYDGHPHELAFFDGRYYHCYENRCFAEQEHPTEIARLSYYPKTAYTPILRCPGCGKLYFGYYTYEHSEPEETISPPPPKPQPPDQDDGIDLPNLFTV